MTGRGVAGARGGAFLSPEETGNEKIDAESEKDSSEQAPHGGGIEPPTGLVFGLSIADKPDGDEHEEADPGERNDYFDESCDEHEVFSECSRRAAVA